MKVYIAAGWFSLEQEIARQKIIVSIITAGVDLYSPRDHGLFIKGKSNAQHVFNTNLEEIRKCTVVVASTEGKDMGTVFECGYAYSIKKPIIYFWESKEPLNLMLSQSSIFVAKNVLELSEYLRKARHEGTFLKRLYTGEIE